MLFAGFIFPFLLASIVKAAPGLELVQPSKRQSITALSSTQISSFTPFTFFASAAYCNPSTTINFTCGGTSSILSFCRVFDQSVLCEQQIALQTRTLSQQHLEATVVLCSSVSVTNAP
jgi:hypothetical protein